jgi:autotransporter-associated beta strand protein
VQGGNSTAINSVISGAGGLTKSGAGTLTFAGATANTLSRTTTVSAGTLQLNNATLYSFSNGFTTGTEGGYFTITAIPEPSTVLAALGLAGFLLWTAPRGRGPCGTPAANVLATIETVREAARRCHADLKRVCGCHALRRSKRGR